MNITMLGTGHAVVTKCYNTCFVVSDGPRRMLVDGGGGSGLLERLKSCGIDWRDLREIFVTHRHMDHIMGILWMVRLICQGMNRGGYDGDAVIYGHDESINAIETMARCLLTPKDTKFIGDRLKLVTVEDGQTVSMIGRDVTFFDMHSPKVRQFGFTTDTPGGRLVCLGDEPYNDAVKQYAAGCGWLMHEAFCLHAQADKYKPYEKQHSTAKDAAEHAESLGVKNLIMYHTEDDNISGRKALYTAEGREHFSGNIYVPDDLETIELD